MPHACVLKQTGCPRMWNWHMRGQISQLFIIIILYILWEIWLMHSHRMHWSRCAPALFFIASDNKLQNKGSVEINRNFLCELRSKFVFLWKLQLKPHWLHDFSKLFKSRIYKLQNRQKIRFKKWNAKAPNLLTFSAPDYASTKLSDVLITYKTLSIF